MSAKCVLCGFTRKDKYKVTHHMRRHLADCDEESAKFILEEIENIKRGIPEFKCRVCDKKFISEAGLRLHSRNMNCSSNVDPSEFKPKKICENIRKYGNNYADLYKIVNTCREKMADVLVNQNLLILTKKGEQSSQKKEKKKSHGLRNFYDEDLSHCSKYADFYIDYLKGISDSASCLPVLIRIYEILYLNNKHKCNQNIIVDDPEFGGRVKLYIHDQFYYIDGVAFFEQILIKHLAEIVFVICQNLLKVFYGEIDEGEYVFTQINYLTIKNALLSFLDNNDLKYRLSRHIYYLTYKLYHRPVGEINPSDFQTYDPDLTLTKPELDIQFHPDEIPQSLNLTDSED